MSKRLFLIAAIVFGITAAGIWAVEGIKSTATFSQAVLRYGAQGQDVKELQGRLQFLDYYRGPIDGDFSWQTLRAVKDFQYRFGLKVDGVVDAKTKVKLYNATTAWRPGLTGAGGRAAPPAGGAGTVNTGRGAAAPTTRIAPSSKRGFSSNDMKLMANAVHGESRGEPYTGQVAVAAVILNRLSSQSFPHTVSGVIFQPGAFTAVADGQIWLEPNGQSVKAVQDAINGWDPTGGCIYYFNPATATNKWIWSRPQVLTIGRHIFCM